MDKIVSSEQVQDFVAEIRNLRQGFVTNFFWDDQKHPYWVENGTLHYQKSEGCYLLLHNNGSFSNLFYIARNMEAVANAIQQSIFENDSVIDVVIKKDGKGEVDVLKELGFETYKYLYRMSHIGLLADESWESSDDVIHANMADCQLVYDALQKDFDPICEQLPSLQEVKDYAQREQLLIIKDNDELCGFLIFEISGTTSWYLRYWYTSPEYRNQRVGARLLKTALVIGKDTKRQQLWVISENDNAIKRYEHYGFKKEPINDYVMIKYK